TLNGGGGGDTLDYSAYSTGVRVNLSSHTALNIGSVTAIENVTGTAKSEVLIGDETANVLRGGGGRDLLIGHGGADQLDGGADDDILIDGKIDDGTTDGMPNVIHVSDGNEAALSAIMAEWTRTDESYAERVHHLLLGGGFNGNYVLVDGVTVKH